MEFASPPKRVVLGDLSTNGNSPISPMANLKLLTKVATGHFNEEDPSKLPDNPNNSNNNNCDEQKVEFFKTSRRFRSLSYMCKKFLSTYKLEQPTGHFQQISLGSLATELGIEKRRVYDIINVVSSLLMAVKVCKDKYYWYGNQKLPGLLSQLKAFALLNKFDEQVRDFIKNHQQQSIVAFSEKEPVVNGALKITTGNQTVFEENRIGVLCQKFIMLFLVNEENWPLNLNVISKLVLTKDIQDKTGMRRLYDVANVLEALGIVKKCSNHEFKKPAFMYCGPRIEATDHFEPDKVFNEYSIHNWDSFGDTNSESSSDGVGLSKFPTVKESSDAKSGFDCLGPPAKKRLLFPLQEERPEEEKITVTPLIESMTRSQKVQRPCVTFIKAPASSFRFSSNRITTSVSDVNKNSRPLPKKEISPSKTVVLNRLDHLRLVKRVTISNIQNGAIYKAVVSNGNMVQFVKLQ